MSFHEDGRPKAFTHRPSLYPWPAETLPRNLDQLRAGTVSRQKPASFTPYFRVEDAEQVRAAFLAAGRAEGYESVSDLIEAAVLRRCAGCSANTTRAGNGNRSKPAPSAPAGAPSPKRDARHHRFPSLVAEDSKGSGNRWRGSRFHRRNGAGCWRTTRTPPWRNRPRFPWLRL